MRVPVFVLSALIGVAILLEGWTLNEIVNLKVEVSAIKTQLNQNHIAKNEY